MSFSPTLDAQTSALRRSMMTQVYAWMAAGLLISGVVAMYVSSVPALLRLVLGNQLVFYGLLGAELIMVFGLSAMITRLSPTIAALGFLFYAVLNGVTLSVIFLVYTRSSIAMTFFVTAGTFGAMSGIGYLTKHDLTSLGHFLMMGLVGFCIGTLVNIFWVHSGFTIVLTYVGILLFVGLTAYDTQKIKRMMGAVHDEVGAERIAVLGALILYLDFINLFLLLLRIFGRRR